MANIVGIWGYQTAILLSGRGNRKPATFTNNPIDMEGYGVWRYGDNGQGSHIMPEFSRHETRIIDDHSIFSLAVRIRAEMIGRFIVANLTGFKNIKRRTCPWAGEIGSPQYYREPNCTVEKIGMEADAV